MRAGGAGLRNQESSDPLGHAVVTSGVYSLGVASILSSQLF